MKIQNSNSELSFFSIVYQHLDSTLYSHGKRIAYIVSELLKDNDEFQQEEKQNIYMLCLLHDIGAVGLGEALVDQCRNKQTKISQTIASYMLLKNFSPLAEYAESVLYHQQYNAQYHSVPIHKKHRYLAGLLYLANAIDENVANAPHIIRVLEPSYASLFTECNQKYAILSNLCSGKYEALIDVHLSQTLSISKMNLYNYLNVFLFAGEYGNRFQAFKVIYALIFGRKLCDLLHLDTKKAELIKLCSIMQIILPPSLLLEPGNLLCDGLEEQITVLIKESSQLLDSLLTTKKTAFIPSLLSEIAALTAYIYRQLTPEDSPQINQNELAAQIKNICHSCQLSSTLLTKLTLHNAEIAHEIACYCQHFGQINQNLKEEYHFLYNMLSHYNCKYCYK